MAMKFHPDKNQGNEESATEQFRKCEEAYKILTNLTEKQQYDKQIGVPKVYKSSFLNMMKKNKEKTK
jgi:DnaJ-class molecular chaperone